MHVTHAAPLSARFPFALLTAAALGACGGGAAPSTTEDRPVPTLTEGWLSVSGTRIVSSDGKPFHGRGANIHDTRSCNACTWSAPNVKEVKRRIDELVDAWHANFVRLDLESYASATAGGMAYPRTHWAGVLSDPAYLADIQEIVAHAASKPGVYVLLSLWVDPTFSSLGWPTTATNQEWAKLAEVFKDEPRVLYGLVNEPQYNFDGAQDEQVWDAMNSAVETIRDVETAAGTPHHVITVQGTRGWARRLDYYLTHPITAGGGVNIAYETHVYNPPSDFADLFETPSATLPVVIGEFGPANMSEGDCAALMESAELHGVPYLAWTFHMRCAPNLIVDNSAGGCGVDMTLTPTSWGNVLKSRLAQPW
jgi:endoglucanase